MPVERQAVEHVLERRVGAEGKEEAEDPDRVPREPFTRRQPARPPSVHQREDRDEGEHPEVQADLGQVVLAEEWPFAEVAVTAVEIRDQREDAERRGEAPGGGEHAAPPLRVTDRLEARQPLNGRKREGEHDAGCAPREHAPPPLRVQAGRHHRIGDNEQGLVEHRLGRAAEDDRRVGDPEHDGPAPSAVAHDVQDGQQQPRDGNEAFGHVHVVDLAQHRSGEREGRGTEDTGGHREGQRPQEHVHADCDGREEDDLGGQPGGAVREDHEEPDEGVERSGVEIRHQGCAAEDVGVPEGQLAVAVHGTDQDVERVILLQVVAGDEKPAGDQVRKHERGRRDGDQHEIGPQGPDVCSYSVH